MKDIRNSFIYTKSISESIQSGDQEVVNEGIKEIFQAVKNKFKQVFEYLRGVVVKLGTYFLPVDDQGNILRAISPLTSGQAYKDGLIDKNNTCVVLDKKGARMVGLNTKLSDAYALYGSGNSLSYWRKALKECQELRDLKGDVVNEVKLHNEDPQAKYNIIVDDDKLKSRIKLTLKNKSLARLMIWGAPGIGKTAILTNVLEEMKKDFSDYRLIFKTLSNETPDNFTLPTYVETEDGRKADDVPKTWLPVYKPSGDSAVDAQLDAACGNGLLFIDELSRATPQVLNVILPLINEGYFNGYKLGSGWTIIVASNRAEDETSGQSDIGNALANRFAQVYYEPTVNTWRKWADKQNFISPLLLQWLSMPESENMSGGRFYYMDPNEDMDGAGVTKLMCTPRSWTNAMRHLAVFSNTGSLEGFSIFDIDRDIIASTLNQYIPSDAIDSFLAFLEVVSNIGDFDGAVRDIWQNGGKKFKLNKKDLNKITLPVAQLVCASHADSLPTEKEFDNLATWLVNQDSDQLASYVLDIFKNIFVSDVSEESRDIIFVLASKIKSMGANNDKVKLYKNAVRGFLNKWGLGDDNIPDYSTGLAKIGEKYKISFKSAIVGDHKDVLG